MSWTRTSRWAYLLVSVWVSNRMFAKGYWLASCHFSTIHYGQTLEQRSVSAVQPERYSFPYSRSETTFGCFWPLFSRAVPPGLFWFRCWGWPMECLGSWADPSGIDLGCRYFVNFWGPCFDSAAKMSQSTSFSKNYSISEDHSTCLGSCWDSVACKRIGGLSWGLAGTWWPAVSAIGSWLFHESQSCAHLIVGAFLLRRNLICHYSMQDLFKMRLYLNF